MIIYVSNYGYRLDRNMEDNQRIQNKIRDKPFWMCIPTYYIMRRYLLTENVWMEYIGQNGKTPLRTYCTRVIMICRYISRVRIVYNCRHVDSTVKQNNLFTFFCYDENSVCICKSNVPSLRYSIVTFRRIHR